MPGRQGRRLCSAPASTPPPVPTGAPSPATLFDVGGGLLLSEGGGGLAAGARAQFVWAQAGGGLGLHAAAQGTGQRATTLGDRTVHWRRWTAALGPAYVAPVGGWQVDGSLGFEAGWLSAHGSGVDSRGGSRFSPGLFALVRLVRPFGASAAWVTLGAAVPLVLQEFVIIGSAERHAFRPLEVQLAVGGSVGRFR